MNTFMLNQNKISYIVCIESNSDVRTVMLKVGIAAAMRFSRGELSATIPCHRLTIMVAGCEQS